MNGESVSTQAPDKKKTPLKWRLLTIAPPILLLAGILVLLYPVLATQYNNQRQERIASEFSAVADQAGPDAVAESLRRADEYNLKASESPILDPWLDAQRPGTAQYQDYLSQLNLNDVMATIKIPSINGESTHTVLTGHTGLGNATMFDQLTSVKVGDVFYIETAGRHLKYEVTDIRVVLPTETESLNKVDGKDLATLITCTPYAPHPPRVLAPGERAPMDDDAVAAEAAQVKGSVMKPWMIAVLAAVALILVVAAVIWVRSRKRTDEEPQVVEGSAAAAALAAADSGDEAGAGSGGAGEPGGAESGDAPPAARTTDLLTSAEQITDEEIDAGRTAALKKMLEERGRQ